jgi:hypothetical protein
MGLLLMYLPDVNGLNYIPKAKLCCNGSSPQWRSLNTVTYKRKPILVVCDGEHCLFQYRVVIDIFGFDPQLHFRAWAAQLLRLGKG